MKRSSGFTIVELLIVVVVIAILAAITIVSYNGITSRAQESAQMTAIDTLAKKAKILATDTGSMRVTSDYLNELQVQPMAGKLFTTDTDASNRNKDRIYIHDWSEDGVDFIDAYWWNANKNSWMHSTITSGGTNENIPGEQITVDDIPGPVGYITPLLANIA